MIRQIVNFVSFIVAGLLLLISAAIFHMWPAAWWFEVRSVRVFDAPVGMPIPMVVDRTIVRDFRGAWVASIRRLEHGRWVSYCTAAGTTNYSIDSDLPDPLTLRWWTYPDCHPLTPGKYAMRTSWIIRGIGPLPDKTVQADSNIFEVTP